MTGPTPTAGAGGERVPIGSNWHVGVHVGSDWSARCFTYPDERPILVLDTPRACLSISAASGTVTANHLDFAHALVQAANDYLIECERLLLESTDNDTNSGSAIAA
ncbi:hypothetical protein [Protofrankia symbiont of Coriaria ruscifolia]|uniref:hypothetical protein n=1 Tax=Protofrankia symbiont of Coriaria ruscifolia TaxID=1306542 RepID=UPI0010412A99|nr:hypothetical protein [Protofrankia symbiont of Coriaria ruscifolia]